MDRFLASTWVLSPTLVPGSGRRSFVCAQREETTGFKALVKNPRRAPQKGGWEGGWASGASSLPCDHGSELHGTGSAVRCPALIEIDWSGLRAVLFASAARCFRFRLWVSRVQEIKNRTLVQQQ